jgi:AcrR family transcriptional regulator
MAARQAKRRVRAAKQALYRELILAAAERVFGQRGYDDAKMEEIARETGLSLQTVYGVFAGKAEIYRELHEAGDRALLQRAAESVRGIEDPWQALRAGVRAYALYFLEHPDFLRMQLREGLTWGSESVAAGSRARSQAWRSGVDMLTTAFARCIERGLFVARDPRLLARMMVAMQQVELAHWLEGGMREPPEAVLREIETQLERSFRLPGARG